MKTASGLAIAAALLIFSVGMGLAEEEDRQPPDAVADLAVNSSGAPEFELDAPLAYTISVTNRGPAGASGVRLAVSFSRGVRYDRAFASQGTCAVESGMVVCDLGGLSAGDVATVTVQIVPVIANVIDSTAEVVGEQADPDTTNNRAATRVWKAGPPIHIHPVGTPV